jgi:uncharacterized protein YjgD (DUF1641 family)
MAHPIVFKPQPHDPQKELLARVEAAPKEHAAALLMAWEVLQTAHDKGMLDLAKGLIGGKDVITGKIADAANLPESVAAIRNGMALARVLGSLDPDMLQRLAKALDDGSRQKIADESEAAMHGSAAVGHRNEEGIKKDQDDKAPSLWSLMKLAVSKDVRRGLGFGMTMMGALGRATKSVDTK